MKVGTSFRTESVLQMNKLDERHINTKKPMSADTSTEQDFASVFLNVVQGVSDAQNDANQIQQQAILAPESVNVADIMIATEKARLSFGMLQAVADRASRAYTEVMNIR